MVLSVRSSAVRSIIGGTPRPAYRADWSRREGRRTGPRPRESDRVEEGVLLRATDNVPGR